MQRYVPQFKLHFSCLTLLTCLTFSSSKYLLPLPLPLPLPLLLIPIDNLSRIFPVRYIFSTNPYQYEPLFVLCSDAPTEGQPPKSPTPQPPLFVPLDFVLCPIFVSAFFASLIAIMSRVRYAHSFVVPSALNYLYQYYYYNRYYYY